jgi:hypothetical protein
VDRVVAEGEAVELPGAHADAAIMTTARTANERTTRSSYEDGMRNLCVR